MPLRPAASITANARYGLHAGSGLLNSSLKAFSWLGLYIGILMRFDLFSGSQQIYTGASYPGTSLLYEFTDGLSIEVISGRCFMSPAIYCFASVERLYSSDLSKKIF